MADEKREVVEIRRTSRSRDHSDSGAPCGACKFLRRKCVSGCVFAPYFGSDQGAARFAAVHKVFGASNVSKLLLHIPHHRRHEAVVTVSYEAQARLSDPVYGCVSTIFALQQQVAALQAELSMVQTQLINSRMAAASVLHHHHHHGTGILSNMSVGLIPSSSYGAQGSKEETVQGNFHGVPVDLDLSPATIDNVQSTTGRGFEPLQIVSPSSHEAQSDGPVEVRAFAHSVLHRKQ